MQQVFIKYIGYKQLKTDTVAGTSIVWNGHGDVRPVPASAVPRLLSFPDIWVQADDPGTRRTEMRAVKTPSLDPIPEADTAEEFVVAEETAPIPLDGRPEAPEPDDLSPASEGEVIDAIRALDAENMDHFSYQGKPKISALKKLLPNRGISMKTVNAAWKTINAGGE